MTDAEPAETYEEYTVYVEAPDNDKFLKFCNSIPGIEYSWKDTHDI